MCSGTQVHQSSASSKCAHTGLESIGQSVVCRSLFLDKLTNNPATLSDQSIHSDEAVSRFDDGVTALVSKVVQTGGLKGGDGLVSGEELLDTLEIMGLGVPSDPSLHQRMRGHPRISGRSAGVKQLGRKELGSGCGKRKGDALALFDVGMDLDHAKKGNV